MKNLTLIFGILALLAGCAYIDQNLSIAPNTSFKEMNIGQGKNISFEIIDDRESDLIGHRADGYGFNAAKIQSKQDIVEVLKVPITQGVKSLGFVVSDKKTTPHIRVALRKLSYQSSSGLWTAGNLGETTLKVIATNSEGENLEKTYRGKSEVRTAMVSSQETNSRVVNEALNQAIVSLFDDKELFEFIAKNK